MNKINSRKALIVHNTRGANLVEYVILVGVIAVIALGIFQKFGGLVHDKVEKQTTTLGGIDTETK